MAVLGWSGLVAFAGKFCWARVRCLVLKALLEAATGALRAQCKPSQSGRWMERQARELAPVQPRGLPRVLLLEYS